MNKDDLIQFLCRKKQYRVSQYEDGSFLVSKTWNHGLIGLMMYYSSIPENKIKVPVVVLNKNFWNKYDDKNILDKSFIFNNARKYKIDYYYPDYYFGVFGFTTLIKDVNKYETIRPNNS